MSHPKIVIAGAGPAGLGCAYTLAQKQYPSLIIEKEREVGGLCRTLDFHGYLFDIGGHRFFSKNEEINRLWGEIMGEDMLRVERISRIYYRKKFFKYPLSFFDVFMKLGLLESLRCVLSLIKYKYYLKRKEDITFEDWVTNRFGSRLYWIFFKTYTEKLWGRTCNLIAADWADQRIKGLSFKTALRNMLSRNRGGGPKTLIRQFRYPRTGPGELYRRMKERISEAKSEFLLGRKVVGIKHDEKRILSIETEDFRGTNRSEMQIDYLFSTLPLPDLIKMLTPLPPEDVSLAAKQLHFRSLLVVNIILNQRKLFRDQWIYVHSPDVKMGRIQNYKNWSSAMVLDPNRTSLGLEYFCSPNDEFWQKNNIDLIDFAIKELERLKIARREHLIDGFVVRYEHAYPVYSLGYKGHVATIEKYLSRFTNIQTLGRSGLFRYDNMDQALYEGICAAKNHLGEGQYNLWDLNVEKTYLE